MSGVVGPFSLLASAAVRRRLVAIVVPVLLVLIFRVSRWNCFGRRDSAVGILPSGLRRRKMFNRGKFYLHEIDREGNCFFRRDSAVGIPAQVFRKDSHFVFFLAGLAW